MNSIGKIWALGTSAVTSLSAIIVGSNRSVSWKAEHPITNEWLSQHKLTKRSKIVDFEDKSDHFYFGLGCHRVVLGGKNISKIYSDERVVKYPSVGTPHGKPLPYNDFLGNPREPVIACSTAYQKDNNRVYEFELALRQGDKGFEERISVHGDKIVSQIVFYERNKPNDDPDVFRRAFGMYRYIRRDPKDSYQWANPNPASGQNVWTDLTVDTSSPSTPTSNAPTHKYFSVWIEDPKGEKIFDNLGVKLNGKVFSSVSEDKFESQDVSDFVLVDKHVLFVLRNPQNPRRDKNHHQGQTQESTQSTIQQKGPLRHYDLSVLSPLVKKVAARRGRWEPIDKFCPSEAPKEGTREKLKEINKISQYCYEVKTERLVRKVGPVVKLNT